MPEYKEKIFAREGDIGVVVFLDALGTKGSWERKDPMQMIERWEDFVNSCDEFLNKVLEKKDILCRFYAFSDTIIITISGKDKDLHSLLIETIRAIRPIFLVGLVREIFLRGCISVGLFFPSEKIIIGKAVDEAAIYYSMSNWVGISAAPSAHKILQEIHNAGTFGSEMSTMVRQYDIPMKNGTEPNGWAITIMKELEEPTKKQLQKWRGKNYSFLRDVIMEFIAETEDIDSSFKWRNTLKFIDSTTSV